MVEDEMQAFENHEQWTAVKGTIGCLKTAGFTAVLAGGCVRDLLLGREPNDFDIATDATPDQVESLFEKSVSVGKAFGVIVLPFEGFQLEVATFREDLEYRDGRRPEGVRFSNMEADAKRRDFTINALFYDIDTKTVIDYVHGQADLRPGLIRAVGEPDRRFDEDKLRLLRAVRFAAQMNFPIEERTLKAVTERANDVRMVSFERIRDELAKLLKQPSEGRRRGLDLLAQTGLIDAIFPRLTTELRDAHWMQSILNLSTGVASAVSFAVYLAPLFRSGQEKEFRDDYIKMLKLDNKTGDAIVFALRNRAVFSEASQIRKGEMALLLAKPEASTAIEVAQALGAKNGDVLQSLKHEIFDENGTLPKPFVTGEDLVKVGLPRGPTMGRLLNEIYMDQIEGAIATREDALRIIRNRIDQTSSGR